MDVTKTFGLSLVIIVFFAILETSAQNFYPLRYGKRDNNHGATEGKYLGGSSKYDRRSDTSSNNDLFYASRYGKRSYNSTPQEVSTEFVSVERNGRYGRSPESDTSGRNAGFYFGSRFGKRSEEGRREKTAAQQEYRGSEISRDQSKAEAEKSEYIVCRYTGFRRMYRCVPEGEEADASSQDQVL